MGRTELMSKEQKKRTNTICRKNANGYEMQEQEQDQKQEEYRIPNKEIYSATVPVL